MSYLKIPVTILFCSFLIQSCFAFDFDYQFGRPVKDGETTYDMYRKKHAEHAQKNMKLPMEAVSDGMDTWHWWVGVDNPGFWKDLAGFSGGPHNYTNLRLDLLRLLMILPREERFKKLGLINDPDAVAAEKPDQFGLKIDRMKDGTLTWNPEVFGYSSGVIGIQLFKNKNFDPKKWSAEKYIAGGDKMEPPYLTGMACVFCHISFNPLNPPIDTANPKWENLVSSFGNQYLREGMAFGLSQHDNSMVYHYLTTQEPGTSETSRFPSDSINNPTNINAILRLQDRLKVSHVEKITPAQAQMIRSMYKNANIPLDSPTGALGGTAKDPTIKVPHILTDGADSLGVLMASVRVYVNEGLMYKEWYPSWPVNIFDLKASLLRGFKPQEFDIIGKWRKDPNSPWMQTERRMPNMATFLMSYDSFPLSEAPNGKNFLTHDKKLLEQGKIVFAENCASCHSSKVPQNLPQDQIGQKKAWRELVMREDFLKDNYLSDDQRHSVLEIGTNMQRAQGTNAMKGWTWGQMSSLTYKEQRAPVVTYDHLYNPLTQSFDLKWKGHAAFYRTPTLVSIWATAPYFHNNALGKFTGDPSVEGRMDAYDDAMEKLLHSSKRDGVKSIKVTTAPTSLPDIFPGLQGHLKKFDDMDLKIFELPTGTPVNLLMSVNPTHFPSVLGAYVKGVLAGKARKHFKSLVDNRREAGIEAAKRRLLEINTCPDFIEDKGHTFGETLSESDKKALTEYMKYF